MSDACFDGYTCHDAMAAVRLHDLIHPAASVAPNRERVVAWLCACGVWRHATSPIRDVALRAQIAPIMERYVRETHAGRELLGW